MSRLFYSWIRERRMGRLWAAELHRKQNLFVNKNNMIGENENEKIERKYE